MANVQRVIPTPLGHSVAKVVRGSTIFEDAQSTYLSRTPSTEGNRRTSTRSYWIKFTQPDDDYDVTVIVDIPAANVSSCPSPVPRLIVITPL